MTGAEMVGTVIIGTALGVAAVFVAYLLLCAVGYVVRAAARILVAAIAVVVFVVRRWWLQ